MRKFFLIGGAVVITTVSSITYQATADASTHHRVLKECRTEDSNNCVWHARRHGNHKGHSLVTIHGITYWIS